MRRKYRGTISLILDILNTLRKLGKATASELSYGSRVPYDRLKPILKELTAKGYLIVEESEGRSYYKLSEKGTRLIEELERVKSMLEDLGFKP